MENRHIFIAGCGYTGQRLARQLFREHVIYGQVRSKSHIATLRALRVNPIVFDIDRVQRRDLSPVWFRNAILFYFVPPPEDGESDTRMHRFLNLLNGRPESFIYISTTGVYGNTDGQLVDESTPLNPQTQRASRRASAEMMSRVWCNEHGVRRVVLRVPAIYGPGRLPLQRLQRGDPVLLPEESPVINRIHVDDLVQACIAAAFTPEARGVYNVSDGNAITMTEYMNRFAALIGLPPPPQVSMEEMQLLHSAEFVSYMEESRRVDNSRLIRELGVKLKYADIDKGLRTSLEEQVAYAARRNKPR